MNDQNNGRPLIMDRKPFNDGMNVNPERSRNVLPAQPPKAPPPPSPKKD